MKENASVEEYVGPEDFNEVKSVNFRENINKFVESKLFIAFLLIFIGLASFLLGRVSKIVAEREPIRIIKSETDYMNEQSSSLQNKTLNISAAKMGEVQKVELVASKNGTKYHYPWCAGAKQISDKNKITFSSIEEARAKGYTPASNCKGLK